MLRKNAGVLPFWKKLGRYAIDNGGFLSVCFLVIAGMVAGALTMRFSSGEQIQSMELISSGFIGGRSSVGFGSIFCKSFGSLIIFLLAGFLFGNFNFGCILIPFLPFLRGLGLGYSLGYMYAVHGAKGLAYSALIIIPPAIISTFAIILLSCESMKFSFRLFLKLLQRAKLERIAPFFYDYCKNYLLYLVLIFAASVVDASFNFAFARFFSFS